MAETTLPERHAELRPGGGARTLDLQSIVQVLSQRWPLILAITVLTAVAAVGAALLMTPLYDATVRLKINPQQRSIVDTQQNDPNQPDQAVVDTEVSIMRSRDLAIAVAKRLDLAADPAFNRPGDAAAVPTAEGGVPDTVIGTLMRNMSVTREPQTYIVGINYRAENGTRAAEVANAYAQEYLASSVERRTGTAARQAKWLDDRLAAMGAEVQQADAAVARYKAQAGITTGGASGTITDQQVAPLSGQLASAEAEAAAARSNVSAARAQIARGGLDAVSSVLNSNTIADLRRQRTEVLRQQAEVSARYGPRHPESLRVTEQLQGIDRAIREEAERIVGSLEAQARSAEASAASLRGNLGRLRSQQATDTRAGVTADSLERQADAKRTVYNQLAQAAQQTGQEQRSSEPQGAVVETARAPERPTSPNKQLFAFLGLLLGGVLGLTVAFAIEFLSTGVRTIEDVEQGLGVPYITAVPQLSRARLKAAGGGTMTPADYVVHKPMSSYAEALRAIRNTLTAGRGNAAQVVAVLSAVPGEGKTSMTSALGRVMALSGDRVVLVDCDLRRGSLGRALSAAPQAGLVELLDGKATLDDVLVRDAASGMDLLPLSAASFSPRDLFGTPAMRDLIQELSRRYGVVMLDTPPLLAVSESRTLAGLADARLMVVKWQDTPRRAVRAALALLQQDGISATGAVLSMANPKSTAVGADSASYYAGMYRQYLDE